MRVVLVLLILAIAAGGWYFMRLRHSGHELATPPPSDSPAPGPFGGTAATPPPPPAPTAAPAPAVADALAKAEAMWTADKGDCDAPDAPTMAALYSQALRGLYGVSGQEPRIESLIQDRLGPLGHALFFTKARYGEDASGLLGVYSATPGESPDRIARRFGMSQQFLNRLRGRTNPDDGQLNVGDVLKVVALKDHGGFFLHIDKANFCLDCFVGGVFAKRYSISYGSKETPTPVGKTHLINRVWHPDWTHPQTHQVIPYGDPANILGQIWLPFDGEELGQGGIGIHGYTGENAGSGKMVSSGCIRLLNDDAVELYNTLSQPSLTPTAVEIVE
jgi:lipoprotein-anchoring transpeptidase ErfK/SrfK